MSYTYETNPADETLLSEAERKLGLAKDLLRQRTAEIEAAASPEDTAADTMLAIMAGTRKERATVDHYQKQVERLEALPAGIIQID